MLGIESSAAKLLFENVAYNESSFTTISTMQKLEADPTVETLHV